METPWQALARVQAQRFFIEHSFGEAKSECGMAGRQQLSFNDLVTALEHLLPRRQLTAEELADIIRKRHYLRKKTKESHVRRSQVALE